MKEKYFMENLLVSIIQSDIVWQDKTKNIEIFDKKIDNTSQSDIIILPEMFNTGFTMNPENNFEYFDGQTVNWLKHKAAEKQSVICGTLIIKENEKYFNRFVIAFPSGELQFYDKRHLFRMAGEHESYSSGKEKVIFEYKSWKIRPLICYDLRFPVWSRNCNDYDLLIFTANWPESRRLQWKSLLVARAIENQAYTIGVNRIGTDGNNFKYSGDSMIISPIGETIVDIEKDKQEIRTAELNLEKLRDYRSKFPVNLDADDFEIKK